MRPWQHSLASVARLPQGAVGDPPTQDWQYFLPVHELLDMSKAGCADRRHRIMLHHCDMGATIAERAFPDMEECSGLVRQHVAEDLGFAAVLGDWLAGVDLDRLPQPVARRIAGGHETAAELVLNRLAGARRLGAAATQFQADAARDVAAFLWMPLQFANGAPASVLSLLMNSVGPSLVRRIFGPPKVRTFQGGKVAVDHGWMAEAVIMVAFGRIPDLAEIVRCVIAEPARMAKPS